MSRKKTAHSLKYSTGTCPGTKKYHRRRTRTKTRRFSQAQDQENHRKEKKFSDFDVAGNHTVQVRTSEKIKIGGHQKTLKRPFVEKKDFEATSFLSGEDLTSLFNLISNSKSARKGKTLFDAHQDFMEDQPDSVEAEFLRVASLYCKETRRNSRLFFSLNLFLHNSRETPRLKALYAMTLHLGLGVIKSPERAEKFAKQSYSEGEKWIASFFPDLMPEGNSITFEEPDDQDKKMSPFAPEFTPSAQEKPSQPSRKTISQVLDPDNFCLELHVSPYMRCFSGQRIPTAVGHREQVGSDTQELWPIWAFESQSEGGCLKEMRSKNNNLGGRFEKRLPFFCALTQNASNGIEGPTEKNVERTDFDELVERCVTFVFEGREECPMRIKNEGDSPQTTNN
tara:strand:- start:756 stop:1940 length:1185 start_codon:yes stop_codon:yes gene_type:complete